MVSGKIHSELNHSVSLTVNVGMWLSFCVISYIKSITLSLLIFNYGEDTANITMVSFGVDGQVIKQNLTLHL